MPTTFDETNEDLCLIYQALHTSLRELCGGDIPRQEEIATASADKNMSPPRQPPESSSSVHPSLWLQMLDDVCRSSIHCTTLNARENLQQKPWNVEVRTITALFNRFTTTKKNRKCVKNKTQRCGGDGKKEKRKRRAVEVENDAASASALSYVLLLTSDFGVTRTVQSSAAFAQLVLPRMEEVLPTGWRGYVAGTGFLLWVSPARAEAMRAIGRRPCVACEAWPKGGEKGLWWHQQEQHAVHHASATACAAATRLTKAVMVYEPQATIQDLLSLGNQSTSAADGANTTNAENTTQLDKATPHDRKTLAFEYAKDGDLDNLQCAINESWVDPVHDVDVRGASLLLWAAGGGHVDVVRYLVETCGCNPRQAQQQYRRGFAGRTALHWACRKGHLAVVRYILQHCGQAALEDRTADGTTAVGWAAWQGQQEILEYMFHQHECDMLTVNKFGCNALLWAAQGTAGPVTMEWLVQVAKCPLTHTNGNGHGILHKAAQRNRPDIAAWFQTYVSTMLVDALEATCRDLLFLLGPDREGCTPSDLAGIEGHTKLATQVCECEYLLWEQILQRLPSLSWPFAVKASTTAVPNEYGPGCGVVRLWNLFQTE